LKSLGQKIRVERKRLGLSQKEVAKGICSYSYLSKIENGKVECDEEILRMLMENLDIKYEFPSPNTVTQESVNEQLTSLHEEIYRTPSILGVIGDTATQLSKNIGSFLYVDVNTTASIELIFLKIYCANQQMNEANKCFERVLPVVDSLNKQNQSLFYIYASNYFILDNKELLALDYLNMALKIMNDDTPLYIKGYTYYLIALSNSRLHKITETFLALEKAIDYSKEALNISRCIDCFMLEAILFMRLKDFERAEKILDKCISLNDHHEYKMKNLGKIYHNKGLIRDKVNSYSGSEEYFVKAMNIKRRINDPSIINTCIQLSKVYYKRGNFRKSLNCITPYLSECSDGSENKIQLNLMYMLNQVRMTEKQDLKDLNRTFKLLEKRSSEKIISEFAYYLSELHFEKRSYKKASIYCKKALLLKT
jgi:HTH-type transcriptional regulator, quorum sensing regulator NprR